MSTATFALSVLSTMHVIVDARRVYIGCALSENSEEYFQNVANETFKNAIHEIETLLADAYCLKIYRCYVVWTKFWIILPPIIGWCGTVVAGTHTVWSISQLTGSASEVFAKQTAQWVISFYSIALATNFIATRLLACKLWMVNRENEPYRSSSSALRPVMLIILECGAIYSVSLLSMIIVYKSQTNGAYVMVDIIGQIIPITFYIIIIRATMAMMKLRHGSTIPLSAPVYASPPSSTQTTGSVSSKRAEVHITKFTEVGRAPYDHSK
ncbi:uncharacterized protein LAESUDRAFT_664626 [Laetiporus sulphureus 93-53]|uniref:Uncharacterized protein n=1 Tax=Laetiporus sulphureus 93-53 TaxID=1314785 RepID=A0A165BIF3_9APHY|nr:uncharacterized protein LAESUDRAFT_664626 [Laetiporus sulphureus 93-53]KZT01117.1 hypothetical protein LAESUDRAFT_664626 [Laetiporus sulphureus 93-53]